MCLIIHKPAGVTIPAELVRNAWADNPNGAGLMYVRDGEPRIYKVMPGVWSDPAEHLARVVGDLTDVEVGLHFRWRTHGPVSPDMTHPYVVPGLGFLMHNGVLPVGHDYTDDISDTLYYVKTALAGARPLTDAEYWVAVGKSINTNKFLVMDLAGRFLEVNPKMWHGYKGLSLSNTHSIPELSNYARSTGYRIGSWFKRSPSYYRDLDDWVCSDNSPRLITGSAAGTPAPAANYVSVKPLRSTRRRRGPSTGGRARHWTASRSSTPSNPSSMAWPSA